MIPNLVHQIWLGRNHFPEIAAEWSSSYGRHMPNWELRRWGDEDLAGIKSQLICPQLVIDERVGIGIRCDVLRCELLHLFGGIYVDHDMEVFRPLDELMMTDSLHFALTFNSLDAVSNALLAAPPGHSFWRGFLETLNRTVPAKRPNHPWDIFHLTGYKALRRAIYEWLGGRLEAMELIADKTWVAGWWYEHADMVVWSREAVHPYHFQEKTHAQFQLEDHPQAYAAHHWQGAWAEEDSAARKKTEARNRA